MLSWRYVLPPSRPSEQHVRWFRHQLRAIQSNAPIAILGSTPEFRDLLAQAGFSDVYVLERNPHFFAQMTEMRVLQTPETVLKGDWMDTLPTCKNRFAAILSDLTSGNVPYPKRQHFYRNIHDALRPGGLFCDKILTHPIPHEPLEPLLRKYEFAPFNLETLNRFNCEVFFCSDLLTTFGRVDTTQYYDYLRGLEIGPTVKAILRELPSVTPPGMIWHYGKAWMQERTYFPSGFVCCDHQLEDVTSPYARRLRCLSWQRAGTD